MFSSENLSDSRTAATESEGQLWNLWWDFPFLKEKKGPCQKPWWTPRVKKTSHQYFFKQAIFPGCGKKFQKFFGTEPWGPVDLPEDFWQGHLAELIDGRQTKVGVSGVAIHHLFKTKQQLRMLVRMYGKNSQNSKHPNLDAKLDIVCVTRSISEIFRCLSIFAYLCSGITIFHQFVIFKDQQLRQWKAKKRHIHTTNLDGKKSAGHKFPFWSWEANLWLLKNLREGPSCRATVYFLVQRALWSLEEAEVRKEGVEVHMTTEVIQKALMYHGGKSWKPAIGLGSWGNVRTLCFFNGTCWKCFWVVCYFLPKFPEVCGEMICWFEAMNF